MSVQGNTTQGGRIAAKGLAGAVWEASVFALVPGFGRRLGPGVLRNGLSVTGRIVVAFVTEL